MDLQSATGFEHLSKLLNQASVLKVLYFYAENSAECAQMTDVIHELKESGSVKDVLLIKIDATNEEEITKKYEVISVPTFIFQLGSKVVDKLVGANVPIFSKKLEEYSAKAGEDPEKDLNRRLKKLIKKAPVMLFMKGSPNAPRCGFSKQVIALLNNHNAKYETFDILEDWDVREGLKKLSDWPTYPQLYIDGELIGGLDILKELSESGELDSLLTSAKSTS